MKKKKKKKKKNRKEKKKKKKKKMKSKHMRYGFKTCWRNNYFTREKTTNIK